MTPDAWLVTAVVTRTPTTPSDPPRPLLVRGTFAQRTSCAQFLHLLRALSRDVVATITPVSHALASPDTVRDVAIRQDLGSADGITCLERQEFPGDPIALGIGTPVSQIVPQ
jgi:hypothetical protein